MKGSGSLRLFIGIPVPAAGRRALREAAQELKDRGIDGRYVPEKNYHVTVKFLGECEDRALLSPISECMHKAVSDVRPFRLTLKDYSTFREGKRQTGHVTVQDTGQELARIYELLDAGLSELGFPSGSKRYIPHITLGRSMIQTDVPPAVRHETFLVNSLVLYESTFEKTGMLYTPLHEETF